MASKTAIRAKGASKPANRPARAPAKPSKSTARKRASPAPSKRPRPSTKSVSPPPTRKRAAAPAGGRAANAFALDKVHQVALQAMDLDAAVEFYRDILGLRFITRFDPPGLAFFHLGGGLRLLLSATASEATLYFRVDDINKAVKQLKKRGVNFLQPPAMILKDEGGELGKKGTEEWMAFFKDPSGNLLALSEQR